MNPFRFITRVFIDVFGITHPTAQQETRAMWFICSMLALIGLAGLVFFLIMRGASHG